MTQHEKHLYEVIKKARLTLGAGYYKALNYSNKEFADYYDPENQRLRSAVTTLLSTLSDVDLALRDAGGNFLTKEEVEEHVHLGPDSGRGLKYG